MDRLRISLPIPSHALHPNARSPWQVVASAKAWAKKDANHATLFALNTQPPPKWKAVRARATFTYKQERKRDRDNLASSLKYYRDSIAATLGMDDDNKWSWDEEPAIVIDKGVQPSVVIEVWEDTSE